MSPAEVGNIAGRGSAFLVELNCPLPPQGMVEKYPSKPSARQPLLWGLNSIICAFWSRLCNIVVDYCEGIGYSGGTGGETSGLGMNGAWYALATLAVAAVIRWFIRNDAATRGGPDEGAKRSKGWRSGSPN